MGRAAPSWLLLLYVAVLNLTNRAGALSLTLNRASVLVTQRNPLPRYTVVPIETANETENENDDDSEKSPKIVSHFPSAKETEEQERRRKHAAKTERVSRRLGSLGAETDPDGIVRMASVGRLSSFKSGDSTRFGKWMHDSKTGMQYRVLLSDSQRDSEEAIAHSGGATKSTSSISSNLPSDDDDDEDYVSTVMRDIRRRNSFVNTRKGIIVTDHEVPEDIFQYTRAMDFEQDIQTKEARRFLIEAMYGIDGKSLACEFNDGFTARQNAENVLMYKQLAKVMRRTRRIDQYNALPQCMSEDEQSGNKKSDTKQFDTFSTRDEFVHRCHYFAPLHSKDRRGPVKVTKRVVNEPPEISNREVDLELGEGGRGQGQTLIRPRWESKESWKTRFAADIERVPVQSRTFRSHRNGQRGDLNYGRYGTNTGPPDRNYVSRSSDSTRGIEMTPYGRGTCTDWCGGSPPVLVGAPFRPSNRNNMRNTASCWTNIKMKMS